VRHNKFPSKDEDRLNNKRELSPPLHAPVLVPMPVLAMVTAMVMVMVMVMMRSPVVRAQQRERQFPARQRPSPDLPRFCTAV
jgi:hypothetical protein